MSIGIIDLSAVFWRYWHVCDGQEVNTVKRNTLAFVRDKMRKHDELYIAMDSPPYKRCEMYPEYKANRKEKPKGLVSILEQTKGELVKEGCIMARCQGWEADDVIATLVSDNMDSLFTIYGADKDLLQVCDGRVKLVDGDKEKSVNSTLGLDDPLKVVDYLALVGDSSDNIPGMPGVGDKTAKALLDKFGCLHGMMEAMNDPENFKPSFYEKLVKHKEQVIMSYNLVKLNNELKLEIVREEKEQISMDEPILVDDSGCPEIPDDTETGSIVIESEPSTPMAIVKHDQLSYRQSLEPIGYNELARAATNLFNSKLYLNKFDSPQAIAAIIMRGRELGVGATTSLDCIDMIQGKPTMSAQLILGLVMRSGVCEYFDCTETSSNVATFITKRKGSKHESKMSFTIEDAQRMNLTNKDNWKKQPATMLRWRCVAALARLVYPDVVQGVYATEEME